MQIPIEQLLNLPDIQVLKVEITEREIRCDIESTRGYSLCHRCELKATKFFEHGETLTLRHLPICEKEVFLFLKTKRYRCQHCDGRLTTTERGDWYVRRRCCRCLIARRRLCRETVLSLS